MSYYIAACSCSPLYVCEKCGSCPDHCSCPAPYPRLISRESRAAAELARIARRRVAEREKSA